MTCTWNNTLRGQRARIGDQVRNPSVPAGTRKAVRVAVSHEREVRGPPQRSLVDDERNVRRGTRVAGRNHATHRRGPRGSRDRPCAANVEIVGDRGRTVKSPGDPPDHDEPHSVFPQVPGAHRADRTAAPCPPPDSCVERDPAAVVSRRDDVLSGREPTQRADCRAVDAVAERGRDFEVPSHARRETRQRVDSRAHPPRLETGDRRLGHARDLREPPRCVRCARRRAAARDQAGLHGAHR